MLFKKRLPKPLRVILIILCLVYGIGFLMIRPFYYGEQEPLSKFRGWIYFQDGPYRGKVVDAETGEPIEGALVAGFWYVDLYGLRISDPLTVFCDAQETMTDKDGAFSLPKGSCFNPWPMTVMGNPRVVVFKSSYAPFPPLIIYRSLLSGQEFKDSRQAQIVKLPRAKSREEKENTLGRIDVHDSERLPSLTRVITLERKQLGLE